jgi:hypothetical protein
VPVRIDAFRASIGPGEGSLSVRNHHSAGLVTLIVAATFTSDEGEKVTIVNVADSWDRDAGFVAAGRSTELPLSLTVAVRGGRVVDVAIRPVYAEFDDGSRFGPTAEELHACLAGERRSMVAASKELSDVYATGGEKALRLALQESSDLSWIQFIASERGTAAAVYELRKQRRLAP